MDQRALQRPIGPKTASADPMIGKVVAGRYRLEARLGEGGMGVVYRARHVLIDRVVALKLIRPDLRGETHLRAWMLREARAANRVDHAHIIDIHDIGETEEGELYLVMEYLVGTPLSSRARAGARCRSRAPSTSSSRCARRSRAPTTSASCTAISRATTSCSRTRGGRKDFVKILDFGLAALARDPRLAPKGAVFGTPEYMSPEQARGEEAGAARAISTRSASSSSRCSPGSSRSARTIATRCSRCSARAPPPKPRAIRPDALPQARGDRPAAAREGACASATRTPTISRKS